MLVPLLVSAFLAIPGGRLLHRLLWPELVYERRYEGVDDGLEEPLVDPQQDGDHNAGDAHHAFDEGWDPIEENPGNERSVKGPGKPKSFFVLFFYVVIFNMAFFPQLLKRERKQVENV